MMSAPMSPEANERIRRLQQRLNPAPTANIVAPQSSGVEERIRRLQQRVGGLSPTLAGPSAPVQESQLPPPPDWTPSEYVTRPAKALGGPSEQFVHSGIRGVTDIFNLVMEAYRVSNPSYWKALRDVGSTDGPAHSNQVVDNFRQFTQEFIDSYNIPPPEGGWEKYAAYAGEAFGVGFPIMVKGAGLVDDVVRAAPRFTQPIRKGIKQAAEDFGGFMKHESASIAGEAGGRLALEDADGGDLIGGMGGAVAPGLAGTGWRGVKGVAGWVHRLFRGMLGGDIPESQVMEVARQRMHALVPGENRQMALDRFDEMESVFQTEGFSSTLSSVTNDDTIRTAEFMMSAHNPELAKKLMLVQESSNRAVIRGLLEKGGTEGSVDSVQQAVRMHAEDMSLRVNKELDSLGINADTVELNAVQREGLKAIDAKIHGPLNSWFDSISDHLDSLDMPVSSRHLKDGAKRMRKMEGYDPGTEGQLFDFPPGAADRSPTQLTSKDTPGNLIAQIENLPDEVPFSQLWNLEKQIKSLVRDSGPDQRRTRKLLGYLEDGAVAGRNAITEGEGWIRSQVPMSKEMRGLVDELAAANTQYSEYARVFRRNREYGYTPTGELLRNNGPALESTLSTYVRGNPEDAGRLDNYFAAFERGGNLDSAKEAMGNFVVTKAWRLLDPDDPAAAQRALNRFKTRHKEAFEKLPELKERFKDMETVLEDGRLLGLKGSKTHEGILRGAIGQFVEEPEKAMRNILSMKGPEQGRAMKALMNKVSVDSFPEHKQGLRQLFLDDLTRRSGSEAWIHGSKQSTVDGFRMREFMEEHAEVARLLYTPHELSVFRDLSVGADLSAAIPARRGSAPEDLAQINNFLKVVSESRLWSPIHGMRRKAWYTWRALDSLNMALTHRQADQVMMRAFIDPMGLGRKLLEMDSPASRKKIHRWLSINMGTLAPRVAAAKDETGTENAGIH